MGDVRLIVLILIALIANLVNFVLNITIIRSEENTINEIRESCGKSMFNNVKTR